MPFLKSIEFKMFFLFYTYDKDRKMNYKNEFFCTLMNNIVGAIAEYETAVYLSCFSNDNIQQTLRIYQCLKRQTHRKNIIM